MCEWESEYDQQEWRCLWVSEVKFFLLFWLKSPPVIAFCNKIYVYHSNQRCLDCFMLHLISGSASNCQNLLRAKAPDFQRKKNCHCNCIIKTFVKNTIRAVFTWLSKGIGFGFGFGFTTPFGWLVYLLWFWFYDSQVKTALKYSNNLNHKGDRALGTGK